MSYQVGGFPVIITGTCAAADYTAKKGFVVSGANTGVMTLTANATTVPVGIIVDPGTGASTKLSVCTFGSCDGSIGSATTFDDLLASDAAGELIPTTTLGNYLVAKPLVLADLADGNMPKVFSMCALGRRYGVYA